MLPDPLHPAVVHFPLSLAVLLPALAALALLAGRWQLPPRRIWSAIFLLQLVLAGSAWLAVETGEDEEELVERVLDGDLIHEHEEAGELLFRLAGLGVITAGLGFLRGSRGTISRVVHTGFAVAVLAAALSAGRLGGELVYEHGAANAYVERSFESSRGSPPERSHEEKD